MIMMTSTVRDVLWMFLVHVSVIVSAQQSKCPAIVIQSRLGSLATKGGTTHLKVGGSMHWKVGVQYSKKH